MLLPGMVPSYRAINLGANDNVEALDIFSNEFKQQSFDIVFATLFFHHFTRDQLVDLFTHLKNNSRCGIVVNDLHRHPLAYYSIKFLTKTFSKSTMVVNDAPLSVHRGFKRAELEDILRAAGITSYSLKWKWAFRWQLIIHTGTSRIIFRNFECVNLQNHEIIQ